MLFRRKFCRMIHYKNFRGHEATVHICDYVFFLKLFFEFSTFIMLSEYKILFMPSCGDRVNSYRK